MREADFYSHEAKKKGYAARSVFKLEELDKKYKLIKASSFVLELGCAPGSWTRYITTKLKKGFWRGVDLSSMKWSVPCELGVFLQGDFIENQKLLIEQGPYHLVLSDAAPSTTGQRLVDTARSLNMAFDVVNIAENSLRLEGACLVKIFQGGDEKELFNRMKKSFRKVERLRPDAVRRESFEIYFLGLGFRGEVL